MKKASFLYNIIELFHSPRTIKKQISTSTASTASITSAISSSNEKEEEPLSATQEMCIHCFDIIIQELLQDSSHSNPSLLDFISPETQCPLFVTWDKKHHNSDFRLRGCIGTLAPRPLEKALGDYAATSAFRDTRFKPIDSDEVCDLRVGVSLLVNYEICDNCVAWDVGVHGIIIKFHVSSNALSKKNHYNGT